MSQCVPRFVLGTILPILVRDETGIEEIESLTTFELTAPLMFPKLMTIARVTLRL